MAPTPPPRRRRGRLLLLLTAAAATGTMAPASPLNSTRHPWLKSPPPQNYKPTRPMPAASTPHRQHNTGTAAIHHRPSTAGAFHGPIRVPSLLRRPSLSSSPVAPAGPVHPSSWRAATPATAPLAHGEGLGSILDPDHHLYQQQQPQQQRTRRPLIVGGGSRQRTSRTRLHFAIQPAAFKTCELVCCACTPHTHTIQPQPPH